MRLLILKSKFQNDQWRNEQVVEGHESVNLFLGHPAQIGLYIASEHFNEST